MLTAHCKDGRDGRDGKDGINGLNGSNGKDGKDGKVKVMSFYEKHLEETLMFLLIEHAVHIPR